MDLQTDLEDTTLKLDIKNIALKAPKRCKSKNYDSFWRIFWISNIPKREDIATIKKEYSQVMANMSQNQVV